MRAGVCGAPPSWWTARFGLFAQSLQLGSSMGGNCGNFTYLLDLGVNGYPRAGQDVSRCCCLHSSSASSTAPTGAFAAAAAAAASLWCCCWLCLRAPLAAPQLPVVVRSTLPFALQNDNWNVTLTQPSSAVVIAGVAVPWLATGTEFWYRLNISSTLLTAVRVPHHTTCCLGCIAFSWTADS